MLRPCIRTCVHSQLEHRTSNASSSRPPSKPPSQPSSEAVEAISIGDVKEEAKWVVKQDDDGKDMQVKSMKYSILYMKAVKALQEAMERIEGLESKVEALENA